jgi:hypothetical protein
MKIIDVVNACQGRICGGTEYMWECYGSNARYLDFSDADGTENVASAVFDTVTQEVYQLDMYVPGYNQMFVWRDPRTESMYLAECERRKIGPNDAWDGLQYVPVDEATALQYIKDICATYYDDLPVPEPEVTYGS